MRHNLFLAFKEAINNAARHSGGSAVWIAVQQNGSGVVLSVKDDGRGFDCASLRGSGNGLLNMRHRLEKMGGRCDIQSKPGGGTTIAFHLPVG